jgi:N-dimethylarginine dimethylaminohydrolase
MMGVPRLPSDLDVPAFLMNFPFGVDNRVANNALMSADDPPYDLSLAFQQFLCLYRRLANGGAVWMCPGGQEYQDMPFVANLGAIVDGKAIISKFTSPPRIGEDVVGTEFFSSLGYEVHRSPYCWEGEADLKHVRDNLYVGGWGQRSTSKAFDWMRALLGIDIVEVNLSDPRLYHLDCSYFQIDRDLALVATSALSREDVCKLEAIVEIADVPVEHVYDGWTNIVRVGDTALYSPCSPGSARALERLLARFNVSLELIDLSEFEKSGAALSCLVMHLSTEKESPVGRGSAQHP